MQVQTPRTLIRARNCKFAKFFFNEKTIIKVPNFQTMSHRISFFHFDFFFLRRLLYCSYYSFHAYPLHKNLFKLLRVNETNNNVGQTIFCSVQSFKPWTRNQTNKFYYDNKVIYKWRIAQWKQSDIKIININHKHSV